MNSIIYNKLVGNKSYFQRLTFILLNNFKTPSSRTGSDVNYSTYPGRAATSLAQAAGLTVTAPDSTSFVASGGATLSRVHWSRQGPTPAESIKRQTLSARGLSDKEFTKHCRGFDGQIKVKSIMMKNFI
jgi:hypothetical protein